VLNLTDESAKVRAHGYPRSESPFQNWSITRYKPPR
jgi:hypothetical protein